MYLAICAAVYNEGLYIKEWLEYHRGIGVEHFYLYDNGSTDNTVEIVKDMKRVTVFSRPGPFRQCEYYNECLDICRHKCTWLAFIDVDEFLVPKRHTYLPYMLHTYDYEDCAAICPYWKFFGSNGLLEWDDRGVLERFTRCANEPSDHIKSIVRPEYTIKAVNPHCFYHSRYTIDEKGERLPACEAIIKGGTTDILQLNHYTTKSREESYIRRGVRHQGFKDELETEGLDAFFQRHDHNEVEDTRALELYQDIMKVGVDL